MFRKILYTFPDPATILIRLMVGAVFISEGVQKFLFPGDRGAGRLEKIGLPEPELLGNMVGFAEINCGFLVLVGLLTRVATVPLIIIMVVAISTTKVDILIEKGLWEMLHASRTDWAMLLGSVFLLIKGGGKWSADRLLVK